MVNSVTTRISNTVGKLFSYLYLPPVTLTLRPALLMALFETELKTSLALSNNLQ